MNLNDFLDEYGGPGFPKALFRGESIPITTFFGIDLTTRYMKEGVIWPLRIHCAIDRGRGRKGVVISPFDFDRSELLHPFPAFGSLVRLFFEDEFEIRVAHMDQQEMVPASRKAIEKGSHIPAGTVIGTPGNLGLSFGAHTHTEIVSSGKKSDLLDELLSHEGEDPWEDEDWNDLEGFVESERREVGAPESLEKLKEFFQIEIKRRGIRRFGSHSLQRMDYLTGQIRTFYDSSELFRI